MTARCPVWLLDVDGVLNAVTYQVPDGYQRIGVDGFGITYRPEVMARIRDWHESGRVQVHWLTTWCELARDELAPQLGLPDFPVEGSDLYGVHPEPNGWWKSAAAQRVSDSEPDRPLVWTDDDLDDAEDRGQVAWLADRTAPTLAVAPSWRIGLTDQQMDLIDRFLTEQAGAAA